MHLRLPTYETDLNKFKTLVHYVCHRAPNPRMLGATKLNKILFYSDIESYLQLGQPITGEVYVKHQFGPVPKHMNEILETLEKEDRAIAMSHASGFNVLTGEPMTQRLFFSLYRPRLTDFTADEISIVDEILSIICNEHTAKSISDFSHNLVWESAEIGEELPYYTAFVHQPGEIGPEDIEWAKRAVLQGR